MIFSEEGVDLPDELLSSLAEGRLVVFAGAGISAKTYPDQENGTYYPLFPALVSQVAARLGQVLTTQQERDIGLGFADRVLGALDANVGEVAKVAAEILSEGTDAKRIECHRAIVRLAKTSRCPQIVTTNFDNLFERAIVEESLSNNESWAVFVAPSLPPLRRFSGVCYLHGRADSHEDLILTDKHIGRAYMDEGWALRFAHSLFRERNILFVGYSLDDPPLRYLSLAMEGATAFKRWVLIRDPGNEQEKRDLHSNWERRNVVPIWYSGPSDDYRALELTIAAWASNTSASFLDRRNLISHFGTSDPSTLSPHQVEVTKFYLGDVAALRDFAGTEIHVRWSDKLLEWGLLDSIVKYTNTYYVNDATGPLIHRVARWFAADHVHMCGLLAKYRTTLHPGIFDQLCRAGLADGISIRVFRQLIEFFRPSLERSSAFLGGVFLETVFVRLVDESCLDDALWLLGLDLRVGSSVTVQSSSEYTWAQMEGKDTAGMAERALSFSFQFEDNLGSHRLEKLMGKVIAPRAQVIGVKVLYWLTDKFREMRVVEARGRGRPTMAEFVRSAIEPHDQDKHRRDPLNGMIVAIRDLWEALHKVSPAEARHVCDYWGNINDPMIERIRLHALRLLVERPSGD